MAVALSGCVITEQHGVQIIYVKKCDYCGYVVPGSSSLGLGSGIWNSGFQCPKCKKKVAIKIRA